MADEVIEPPFGRDEPILYPRELLDAAKADRRTDANVYCSYEQQSDGMWRCYLTVPVMDALAEQYGRKPGDPLLWGEAPTKQEAKQIAVEYLEKMRRNGEHVTTRLRVDDAMRSRRMR